MVPGGDGDAELAVLRQRDERASGSGATERDRAYPKDGINDHVVHGAADGQPGAASARRPRCTTGSTVAGRRDRRDPAAARARRHGDLGDDVRRDAATAREREADEFYAELTPGGRDAPTRRCVLRQAFAGMLWEQAVLPLRRRALARRRPGRPAAARRRGAAAATRDWRHLNNRDVISMPDTWEYPWYAAWDLAFHCVALAHVDPEFAKEQLLLLLPRVVHAPQRPAARVRVGVRRRQPAGARVGGAAGLRDRRRRATSTSSSASSTSCCSTSPGG